MCDLVAVIGFDGGIIYFRSGTQVLDELADSKDLSGQTELVLQLGPWLYRFRGIVGSVEIPGVESAEVLNGSQHLIATDWNLSVSAAGVAGLIFPHLL